jgi:predicted transcriptional regulator
MNKSRRLKFTLFLIASLLPISVYAVICYSFKESLKEMEKVNLILNEDLYSFEVNPVDLREQLDAKFLNSLEYIGSSTRMDGFFEEEKVFLFVFFNFGALISGKLLLIFKNSSTKSSKPKDNDSGEGVSIDVEKDALIREELKVLELVYEYLDRNRVLTREKITSFVNARISKNGENINSNGIRVILNSLLKKNLIVEGSKLTKENILLNSNRKRIYDYIKENPGVYLNRLAKELNFSVYLVNWHLNMLLKFNIIRRQTINNCIAYYDSNLEPKTDVILHLISRKSCRKIVDFLEKNRKGCSKYQISKDLNMHYNTIAKYLDILDDFGLVVRSYPNKKMIYSLNREDYVSLTTRRSTKR